MNRHCISLACGCANIYAPPTVAAQVDSEHGYVRAGVDLAELYANRDAA